MFEARYTNDILLNVVERHVQEYKKDLETVESVRVSGETQGENRVVTFEVTTHNVDMIDSNTCVETNDPIT